MEKGTISSQSIRDKLDGMAPPTYDDARCTVNTNRRLHKQQHYCLLPSKLQLSRQLPLIFP